MDFPMLWLFWISACVLVFTFAGYPLVLFPLGRFRRGPVIRPEPFEPTVSLIIPARNEERHIRRKLENCLELDYPPQLLEVIVVDDGSSDGTGPIVEAFLAEQARRGDPQSGPRFRKLRVEGGRGKVVALNRAVFEAKGDVVVFSDADSLISRPSLCFLVHPFVNPIVGCVAGRYFPGGVSGRNAAGVGFYWKYENYLRRKESQAGGLLGASGALYAVRREAYEPLPEGVINDDFIIPMTMTDKGFRSLYEPRATAVEDESRNCAVEYSRRVRIMAGNCEYLWRFRHMALDRRKWRTVTQLLCHKFLRVASPLLLMTLFVSNAALLLTRSTPPPDGSGVPGLAGIFHAVAFFGQCLFYSLALFGYSRKGEDRVSKLLTLPYYFCMVNLSALHGIYYFLFNRAALPWSAAVRQREGDAAPEAGLGVPAGRPHP
jgi:cellulose synthase/poly-beta-1,6-N-acetylglucosamine synthase-like glycosyltransferase